MKTQFFVDVQGHRFEQVLRNLLSNAAKFSASGSEVEFSVRRDESSLTVSVKDNGPGIPAEFKGKIFEQLTQIDSSSTRKHADTGLGHSNRKSLTEAMGGKLFLRISIKRRTGFFDQFPHIRMTYKG